MGREYRITVGQLLGKLPDLEEGMKGKADRFDECMLLLAIAERLEALVEVMEEKLTQIAQNLAK